MWVEYPILTLVPVALFGAALWKSRRSGRHSRGLVVATVGWALYAVYELIMFVWSQRVIAPIRIDLILLGPLMYLVTALGIFSWWRMAEGRSARAA